ncbi:MAG TPA: 3-phosphoshikimate 1-carboxyvinyltransferase [Woeseiaceae bacterium]|nr:3-phosphoshikimate 1-carboxyvinyltransferase [Woeseiaceae bacterium]
MDFRIEPQAVAGGTITVPGDKSVSHRALMFGSIADGTTRIGGFLAGEDCLATLSACRAMGVAIESPDPTHVVVHGVGLHGLRAPRGELDLGNSGTAMRLMCGLLAGQPFDSTLTGDASLSGRPMSRVIRPLEAMGASIESRGGKPPLCIRGGRTLTGIDYALPMASAQVKSCVLLAGLYAAGRTTVREPAVTRDHTERMLRTMGVTVDADAGRVSLEGGQALSGSSIDVPADLSSATFPMLAAIVAEEAELVIENVGINPTRTGVLDILRAMGADVRLENRRDLGGEPVADLRVRSSRLTGGVVDPALVSLAIDEFPALFIAAAYARGRTTFSGLGELRVKESDRVAAMAQGLRTLGVAVDETPDGAVVHGGRLGGGIVESHGDHRIAMAFAAGASAASGPVTVRDIAAVDTSFPGFGELMRGIGLRIETEGGRGA